MPLPTTLGPIGVDSDTIDALAVTDAAVAATDGPVTEDVITAWADVRYPDDASHIRLRWRYIRQFHMTAFSLPDWH